MILTDNTEAMAVKNMTDLTDNTKENKKGKRTKLYLTLVMKTLYLWFKAWENIKTWQCSFKLKFRLFITEILQLVNQRMVRTDYGLSV